MKINHVFIVSLCKPYKILDILESRQYLHALIEVDNTQGIEIKEMLDYW